MLKDLKEIQNDFQNYLVHSHLQIISNIESTKTLSAKCRLDIYRDSYYLRLLEILEEDYPVLFSFLGEDNFFAIGYAYIDKNPSQFRSIQYFGKKFPIFIKNYLKKKCMEARIAPISTHILGRSIFEKKWLVELASFECLLSEVFEAADERIITIAEMAAIPFEEWPAMKFILHPSLRLIKFNWNIVPIWKKVSEETDQLSDEIQLIPEKKRNLWMLWRKEYEVKFSLLQKEEFYMLEALQKEKNFSEVCEDFCKWIAEDQVAVYAATLLKQFILDGVIAKVI